MNKGLYRKFKVIRTSDNTEVEGAFVLRPESDVHAQVALRYYADSVAIDNPVLAREIHDWMASMACEHTEMPDDIPCEFCAAYENCPLRRKGEVTP